MNIHQYQASIQEHGGLRPAARALGIPESTLRSRMTRAAALAPLESVGYDFESVSKTPEQAWDEHVGSFQRKIAKNGKIHTLKRKGAFVVFHATDEHVDDDASALHLLESDIVASRDMGAVMCHGGDLLNNWPMGGKLAKQWAEQSCTRPDALLRAKHFIDIFKPDVWVDGNHEEMNPYLVDLFDQWLPKGIARDYWRSDFIVEVEGGRGFRGSLSHKFQKGSSHFHALHGHIREAMSGSDIDLYMDGHFHQAGVMVHHMPERGLISTYVASRGYKLVDYWAQRISKGGKTPATIGRAHWAVVDPYTEGNMVTVVDSPEVAGLLLGRLQNLREV